MFILGLQGSPRRKGNTDTLLGAFLDKAAAAGASTHTIQADRAGVASCRGCGYCEKHGTCVIRDDPMSTGIFGLLREADMVVAASPVYFYGVSAQLKLLIDRCQTLWSRKYVYKLKDPLAATRTGVLFSVAASRGKQLFDGVHLTAKYFFDAIDARFAHTLVYRGIEAKDDMSNHPTMGADLDAIVAESVTPFVRRRRVIFVSAAGAMRAPMAAAVAQMRFGDRIRSDGCGVDPGSALSGDMVQALQQAGIDLAYRRPATIEAALRGAAPDIVVTLDPAAASGLPACAHTLHWDIPHPTATDADSMQRLLHTVERHAGQLQRLLDSTAATP